MVPFAGWEMPVQYPDGILQSHLHTRQKSSLFDVSHMGQLKITGKDRDAFIERITVVDMKGLRPYRGCYSLMPNEQGGIIDDTIISNLDSFIYMVVNAGCYDKDMLHIRHQEKLFKESGKDVTVENWEKRSLVALQGPTSEKALQNLTKGDLTKLFFFHGGFFDILGSQCYVQRSGYTGEDGFEISIPTEKVEAIASALLEQPDVKPCGLGARDSLRLEAGLSLYGHELDDTTTPKQANLLWTISKRRTEEGGFIGDKPILAEIPGKINDLPRRRVGLAINGSPAREGTTVHDPETKKQIGIVTSGTFSPVLKKAVAMGYVAPPHHKLDGTVLVNVRDKFREATVVKLPFVPTNYKVSSK
uniref:Aminomethyltransferase n=1 Tax=Arcella intermedia TaxID=1963864 RepID=A0A6B2L6Y1_9EUKA